MPQRGIFITFEGTDGCGKTTQMRLLGERLRDTGRAVVESVEPGGTEIGKQIRRILLDPANKGIVPLTELLLYFASRAQNVEQVIRPALAQSTIVLCDRFTDSTLAYQGCGRGLATQPILELDRLACNGLQPDLTFLIDADVELSSLRSARRNFATASPETRIDGESSAFHTRVRKGYLALAKQHPNRIRVIDGSRSIEQVAASIWERLQAHGIQ